MDVSTQWLAKLLLLLLIFPEEDPEWLFPRLDWRRKKKKKKKQRQMMSGEIQIQIQIQVDKSEREEELVVVLSTWTRCCGKWWDLKIVLVGEGGILFLDLLFLHVLVFHLGVGGSLRFLLLGWL